MNKPHSGFKKTLAVLLTVILAVPFIANAQDYGIPAGVTIPEGFSIPEGTGIPEGFSIPEGMGPPAGVEEMAQKGFARLKESASSMNKAVVQMDKVIAKVKQAGYTVPAEVETSLAKAKTAIETIKNAPGFNEDVQTALDDFNAFVDVLDLNMEGLQLLAQFPRVLKQADKEMTKLKAHFEKMKKKLDTVEVDISAAIAKGQEKITAMQTALDSAKTSAQNGNAEEAFNTLQDVFFDGLEETHQYLGMLEAMKNLSRAVKMITKGIKSAEKMVTQLKKKKADTSAAETVIANTKTALENLKNLLKADTVDIDAVMDAMENLDILRDDFDNAIDAAAEAADVAGFQLKPIDYFGVKGATIPSQLKKDFPTGGEGDSGYEKMDFGF